MTENKQALLDDFVTESRELLEKAEGWLMALEGSVEHPEIENVHNVFRSIHSVKGSANFLGLVNIGELSHACESLLDEMRDGRLEISVELIDLLLRCNDRLRALVEDVAFSDEIDVAEDMAELHRWTTRASPPTIREKKITPEEPPEGLPARVAETLRVKTGVLDGLLDTAGELVIARNRLLSEIQRLYGRSEGVEFLVQQMDATIARLQTQIMRARLQPLTVLLDRFRRVARDLAVAHGKKVDLLCEGDEVELDRAVLEVLSESLIHLLRNSVDHGIEPETDRIAAGKPGVGTIRIEAVAQSDSVLIDVADDGAGIDVDGLMEAARTGGYWLDESDDYPDEAALMNLVTQPGLTTAREISGLSGRGVGLDVVRGNLTRLGGSISVSSEKSRGTRFRLKLPMTLLIQPTLIVQHQQYHFAIPRRFVEGVRRHSDSEEGLQRLGDTPVLKYRGDLIPVLSLSSLLETGDLACATPGDGQYIVILSIELRRVGLLVDKVLDHADSVVTRLSRLLESAGCYTGTTILGDGAVALVLDPSRLIERAGMRAVDVSISEPGVPKLDESKKPGDGAEETYLLCTQDGHTWWAMKTSSVRRVRRLQPGEPISADGLRLVRHEEQSVPLIEENVWSGRKATSPEDVRYVIIAGDAPDLIAISARDLVDVTDSEHGLQLRNGDAKYLRGTIEIDGRVAGVLDVSALAATLSRRGGED